MPENPPKRTRKLFYFGISILLFSVIGFFYWPEDYDSKTSQNSTISNLKEIRIKGWECEKTKVFSFSNMTRYNVSFYSKTIAFEYQFKMRVYKLDESNNAILIWESPKKDGYRFESIKLLKSSNEAIIAGVYNLGGAHQVLNYFLININNTSTVNPVNIIDQGGEIHTTKNTMLIEEENQNIQYSVKDNHIIRSIDTRENMINNSSVKVFFSAENNFISTSKNLFYLNKGQSISFIPLDESTKKSFNMGEIEIYTDSWNYDFSISEANRLTKGNSYKFMESGEFHFILCKDCYSIENPQPTFTFFVK